MLRVATIFGILIGLLLLVLQFAPMLLLTHRGIDWFPALAGAVFLIAGVFIGARWVKPRESNELSIKPAVVITDANTVSLTEREIDILIELSTGKTNAEIARDQFVSINTVKTHVKNVCGKLGVSRRGQAVARARELAIIEQ